MAILQAANCGNPGSSEKKEKDPAHIQQVGGQNS
jgi:hypothetical protein